MVLIIYSSNLYTEFYTDKKLLYFYQYTFPNPTKRG